MGNQLAVGECVLVLSGFFFGGFTCVRSFLRMSSNCWSPMTVDYLDWMTNKFWWIVYDLDETITASRQLDRLEEKGGLQKLTFRSLEGTEVASSYFGPY